MLGSRSAGGFFETDRSLLGKPSEDIEVVAGALTPRQLPEIQAGGHTITAADPAQ
jgi:hypothetical protein